MTGPAQPHRTAQLRTATRSLARLRSALLRSATRNLARLRSMLLRSVGGWRLGVVMKRSGYQVRMDSSLTLLFTAISVAEGDVARYGLRSRRSLSSHSSRAKRRRHRRGLCRFEQQ